MRNSKKGIAIAIPFFIPDAALPVTPMATMPAMAPTPMTVTPAPVAVTPAPVTVMPTPVTVMPVAVTPTHLLRLELGCFLAGGDGRMSVRIRRWQAVFPQHLRRERRGLRGGGERGSSRRDTECKFQKVPALHDLILCFIDQVMQNKCRGADMNRR
ncbi:hypothetical protein XH98_22655 [Bradyrhizobium sp. CCBAU 51745]|nr:hypothetical protein [Bradyrhizobium sp. CCBAU 45384]MDA9441834.1 hypothetical protein [Bradyrhizobium sp. CCBAU 51745]